MALQQSAFTPLVGFAPDLDPQTPGIMLDCNAIYPTRKGFRPTQAPVPFLPALPTAAVGGYRARYTDGSERLFAGTTTKLWGATAMLWTDLSGTAYSALGRWRFAQFGDHVIATDFSNNVQVAPEGSSFSDLGGSPPRAKIVVAVNNFVFLLNTSTQSNQWWCSGIGTDNVWTPDIATQAANGLLVETYGEITAGHKLGPELVVYKLRSMYNMQYLGPPVIWGSQLLSAETGTWGQEAVVEMADVHVFPGYNDFYTYSGGRPQPLECPLREFFFQQSLDQNYGANIIGRWDHPSGVVVWHYPSTSANPAGTLDKWIAWHPETNHWTRGDRVVEYAMQSDIPLTTGVIYDNVGQTITTYDSGSSQTYDTLFPSSIPVGFQAVFLTDHILYTLSGTREASYILTGDIGDDELFQYMTRVKPRFSIYPISAVGTLTYGNVGQCYGSYSSAGGSSNTYSNVATCLTMGTSTMTEYYKTNLGDTLTTGQTAKLASQGWYNIRRSSRFKRLKFVFLNDYEILGYEPVIQQSGAR